MKKNILTEIKFPTLPALLLFSISTFALLFHPPLPQLPGQVLSVVKQPTPFSDAENIHISNLTPTSATIIWKTPQRSLSQIIWGPTSALGNTQTSEDKNLTYLHSITLNNLLPNQEYLFQIDYQQNPSLKPFRFKTSKSFPPQPLKPIIGKVLTSQLTPSSNTEVLLNLGGASNLSAFTTPSGSFILPLVNLTQSSLAYPFDLAKNQSASLLITDAQNHSEVKIILPFAPDTLPPVILGQDYDFTNLNSLSPQSKKYDLNDDGIINSIDLSLLVKNLNKNPQTPGVKKFDLNQDNLINQKDLDLLKSQLK